MTGGVGNEVAPYAVTPEVVRESPAWHARFLAAFGGAVVIVWFLVVGAAWQGGLRASDFGTLRNDLSNGTVREWYVAQEFEEGPLGVLRAPVEMVPDDSATVDPHGGIIVWRTWGATGWQAAAPIPVHQASENFSAIAAEESTALVHQLRSARVPMKPYEWGARSPLDWVYQLGAIVLLGRLIFGPVTRLGTKWFWFWAIVIGPVGLGAIAYAVTELIGFRRRPDVPLTKRWRGGWGFLLAVAVAFLVSGLLSWLRSRGVPIPL